jgi:hypothetical protein
MALVYRAIWQDDTEDLSGWAHGCFADRVSEKYQWLEVPGDGHAGRDDVEVRIQHGEDDEGWIHRAVLNEDEDGDRWSTTLTCLAEGDGQWVWVADRGRTRLAPRPPRPVRVPLVRHRQSLHLRPSHGRPAGLDVTVVPADSPQSGGF